MARFWSHTAQVGRRFGTVFARGHGLLALLCTAMLVPTTLLPSADLFAEAANGSTARSGTPATWSDGDTPAATADPGPGDSGSVLQLQGIGRIAGSVLEYRVREPSGEIVVAPRITLLAVAPDGTQYTLLLIPLDPTRIFGQSWDIGSPSPTIAGTDERSAMTVVKDDEEYVSSAGTVILRSADHDRFTAEIEATMVRVGESGGQTESLRGKASGVWTFTCFAVTTSPGDEESGWGADGGAVAWFLDESLRSPYCARFQGLASR